MTQVDVAPATFGTQERMSWLIHGWSKRGKSTLAATAPKPILVLDAEGSWRFIPGKIKYWDPAREQPPAYDGTWDICVVHVQEWATVQLVYQYLTQWPLPFVSVVIDSITEIQRRAKSNLKGTEAMKIADWGVLLAIMDATIRGFRDLCLMPQLPVRCVVFVAESKETQTGRIVPAMQGQIGTSLPYWVDICAYYSTHYDLDSNGQATRENRELYIGPHQQYESGERVQGKLGYSLIVNRPAPGTVGVDLEHYMRIVFDKPWPTIAPVGPPNERTAQQ